MDEPRRHREPGRALLVTLGLLLAAPSSTARDERLDIVVKGSDTMVIYVNEQNPVREVELEQLGGAFAGRLRSTWAKLVSTFAIQPNGNDSARKPHGRRLARLQNKRGKPVVRQTRVARRRDLGKVAGPRRLRSTAAPSNSPRRA